MIVLLQDRVAACRRPWRSSYAAAAAVGFAAAVAAREDPGAAFTLDLAAFRTVPAALRTWRELPPLRAGWTALTAIAVSADGRFAAADGRDLVLGRLDAGADADRRLRLPSPLRCLAFAPDGALVAGFDRSYVTFSPTSDEPSDGPTLAESSSLTSIAVSSNHMFAADAGQKMVWIFDRTGRLVGHIQGADAYGFAIPVFTSTWRPLPTGPHGWSIPANSVSSSGRQMVAASECGVGLALESMAFAAVATRSTSRCCPMAAL